MKYMDEYRDAKIARGIAAEIRRRSTQPWVLMEICGGQTHTLMRYGIDELLGKSVELVHGPGCPVCVTPLEMIDRANALARRPNVTLLSYGDMLRVPGSETDLFHVKAEGGDVRIVYSPTDAVELARNNPDRQVVFFAIGFETTAPAHAMAVLQAERLGLKNFSLLVSHVLVPPAIRMLLQSSRNRVQGFIAPGHVCTIVGVTEYEELVREFHVPIVVGGFEPVDLLEAIRLLVVQLEEGRTEVENSYSRTVLYGGNRAAQDAVERVFEVTDRKWRGVGEIGSSGLRLQEKYAAFDAERLFGLQDVRAESQANASARKFCWDTRSRQIVPRLGRGARRKSRWAHRWFPRKVPVQPITNIDATSLPSEGAIKTEIKESAGFACPVPLPAGGRVLLGHGSGGRLSAELLNDVFLPVLGNPVLDRLEDQAVVSLNGTRLAMSTDSFVVKPLFFKGGDIGSLAVHGTINDLAMGAAKPLWMSVAFILEEGLEMDVLRHVVASMQDAAEKAGVQIVTGDTKVVEKGSADGMYINTTGVGLVREGICLSASQAKVGDAIIVSGMLGDHGIAILAEREGLKFETEVRSDSAPLHELVKAMLDATHEVRCLRDPTRGGISSTLNEIAGSSRVGMELDEATIPVREQVRGACEMLGLDPMYVANEGKLVAIVSTEAAERALAALRSHPLGAEARIIGRVTKEHPRMVVMRTTFGTTRIVDMLAGDQLPRIC